MGAITGASSKLFGDGSVLDQLKEFAKLGAGLGNAGAGIGLITSGLSKFSSTVNSFPADKLSQIVKTINDINPLKAAAFSLLGGKIDSGVALPTQKLL